MLQKLQQKIYKSLRNSYQSGTLHYKGKLTVSDCKTPLTEEERLYGALIPPLVFYLPHEIFGYKNLFCPSCKKYGNLKANR